MTTIHPHAARSPRGYRGALDGSPSSDPNRSRLPPFRSVIIIAAVSLFFLAPPVRAQTADPYAPFVTEAAQRFGIPESWIQAVMRPESAGDPRAVSPMGAMGLMQIMPGTWTALRARHSLGADPFAPRDNILAGAAFLREMHDRYGSVALMLAAYNAGPGRVDEHLATGRMLPAETRAYVATLAPTLGGGVPSPIVAVRAATADDFYAAPLFVPLSSRLNTGTDPAAIARAAASTADEARQLAPRSEMFATSATAIRLQPNNTAGTAFAATGAQPMIPSTTPAAEAQRLPRDSLFAVSRPRQRQP